MDVRIILMQLREGSSDRQVSRDTGVARDTVKRYRAWATRESLLEGELPNLGALQLRLDATLPRLSPPQNSSSVEPYRDIVVQLRRDGVEMRAIHARIRERGFCGSYSAVYRFVQALEGKALPDATVRVERAPGEEAQVDFGAAGYMRDEDGRIRKAWVFVMTLSYSRHQYVEFVFDQSTPTWLALHVRAFAFFGGCPARMTTDNLKAAIIKAAWDDPEVNRAYSELAQHYEFLIAPCRPRTPQHKGKVESAVHYVARNFMGGRAMVHGKVAPELAAGNGSTLAQPASTQAEALFLNREGLNRDVRAWCLNEAGLRCHGTTREAPLHRFESQERAALKPLPQQAYDLAEYRTLKLHRDCHVVFDNCYYSAPCQLIGQKLWVRGGLDTVRIYDQDYQLVATHERGRQPGTRRCNIHHLPPGKVPGLMVNREEVLQQAAQIGVATLEFVETMLQDPVLDKLVTAGRLLRLQNTYGATRLEAACQRAHCFSEINYKTVKGILEGGLDITNWPRVPNGPVIEPAVEQRAGGDARSQGDNTLVFARSNEELVGHLTKVKGFEEKPWGDDAAWQ